MNHKKRKEIKWKKLVKKKINPQIIPEDIGQFTKTRT